EIDSHGEKISHTPWHPFFSLQRVITFLQKPGAWYNDREKNTRFSVWAPLRKKVALVVATPEETIYPMEQDATGHWCTTLPLGPGTRYGYRLDNDPTTLPDPAS